MAELTSGPLQRPQAPRPITSAARPSAKPTRLPCRLWLQRATIRLPRTARGLVGPLAGWLTGLRAFLTGVCAKGVNLPLQISLLVPRKRWSYVAGTGFADLAFSNSGHQPVTPMNYDRNASMRTRFFAVCLICTCLIGSASGAPLTETFPNPLGAFYSGWLGSNTNMGSVYLSDGDPDINYRGNNPQGLWISGNQTVGGGTAGSILTINFNPSFGATLTSLSFGVEAFVQQQISIYDLSNNLLATGVFSGGDFGFGHEDVISAVSANGIGSIVFDSSSFGNGQISGNTSVDNFLANVAAVPEPASMLAWGLIAGVGAVGYRLRKRNAAVA